MGFNSMRERGSKKGFKEFKEKLEEMEELLDEICEDVEEMEEEFGEREDYSGGSNSGGSSYGERRRYSRRGR